LDHSLKYLELLSLSEIEKSLSTSEESYKTSHFYLFNQIAPVVEKSIIEALPKLTPRKPLPAKSPSTMSAVNQVASSKAASFRAAASPKKAPQNRVSLNTSLRPRPKLENLTFSRPVWPRVENANRGPKLVGRNMYLDQKLK
jgi:hypothetical protein